MTVSLDFEVWLNAGNGVNGLKTYAPSLLPNPYLESKLLLERLSLNTEVDASLIIGIVVTNKRVNINVTNESKQLYAIQINKLPKLIKAIEARLIPTINEQQLARAVKVFDKLNRRRD